MDICQLQWRGEGLKQKTNFKIVIQNSQIKYKRNSNNSTFECTRGLPGSSAGKESSCNAGDLGLIPGLGRSPAEGNSYPLQYSCLGNSMNRGAWKATVHGVTKSCDMTESLSLSQDSLPLNVNKSRKNHFVSHLPFHPKLHVFPTLLVARGLPSPQQPPTWLPPQQPFTSAGGRALQQRW